MLNAIIKGGKLVPSTQLLLYCKLFIYDVIATSFFIRPFTCEIVSSQGSQSTYNVTLRFARATVVAVEEQ
jgi:hypothetical protein